MLNSLHCRTHDTKYTLSTESFGTRCIQQQTSGVHGVTGRTYYSIAKTTRAYRCEELLTIQLRSCHSVVAQQVASSWGLQGCRRTSVHRMVSGHTRVTNISALTDIFPTRDRLRHHTSFHKLLHGKYLVKSHLQDKQRLPPSLVCHLLI